MKNVFTQAQAAMKHLIKHSTHKHRSGKGVVTEATRPLLNFSLLRTPFRLAAVLCFLLTLGVGEVLGATLTCTFEQVTGKTFPYNDAWELTAGTENTTYHHGGNRCVTLNSASFVLQTKNKISGTITNVTYYAGRTSNNSTSTNVYIETSTDGSSWTKQNTYAISGAGRLDNSNNNWSTVSQDMNVSNCYVRISRIGGGASTAVRAIDDVTITYTPAVYNVTFNRNGVTETINNVEGGTELDNIDGDGTQGGCSAWTFVGWSKSQRTAQNSSDEMSIVSTVEDAGPYYAVYSHSEEYEGSRNLMCTFEQVTGKTFPYNDAWELTAGTENTTYHHGGNRCVTLNSASFVLQTKNKISGTITNVTYYAGRTSNNSTSTNVYIETSTDGSSWTKQNTYAISGAGRLDNSNNNWSTVSQDMNVSNCYVRISRIGGGASTAVRAIDDVTITYSGGTITYYSTTATCCDLLGTINGSFTLSRKQYLPFSAEAALSD